MKREKIQEVNSPSNQNRKRKVAAHKKSMPIVRCVCGSQILVVPDLKAMNFAINHHITEHKRAGDGAEGLTQFLTKQVLKVASTTNVKYQHAASKKSKFSKVTELESVK